MVISTEPAAIIITDHIRWARTVARGVSQKLGFQIGGQEEQELESEAYCKLVEKTPAYQIPTTIKPGTTLTDAFRGWMHQHITFACRREAYRLRNGGTYNTRREDEHEAIAVVHVGELDEDAVDYLFTDRTDNTSHPALFTSRFPTEDAMSVTPTTAPGPMLERIDSEISKSRGLLAAIEARIASLQEFRRHFAPMESLLTADMELAALMMDVLGSKRTDAGMKPGRKRSVKPVSSDQ